MTEQDKESVIAGTAAGCALGGISAIAVMRGYSPNAVLLGAAIGAALGIAAALALNAFFNAKS